MHALSLLYFPNLNKPEYFLFFPLRKLILSLHCTSFIHWKYFIVNRNIHQLIHIHLNQWGSV